MFLAEAIEGLKLNPLDDQLYQAIRVLLRSASAQDPHLSGLRSIFDRLDSGSLKFVDLEQSLADLDLSSLSAYEMDEGHSETQLQLVHQDKLDLALLPTFLEEVEDHIETLAASLSNIDPVQINKLDFNSLFRAAHTIKGSAASVGLNRFSSCIHEFEDLLSMQREHVSLEVSQFGSIESFVKLLARSLPILKRGDFDNVPYDLLTTLNKFALSAEPVSADIQSRINAAMALPQAGAVDVLKISAQRINALFNEVERLQSMLTETDRIIHHLVNEGFVPHVHRRKLGDLLSSERLITNQLQKELIAFRLVPFRQLLPRIRRIVDDYSKASGKDIHLLVVGEMVEIKKAVVDRLADILLHVIKNAMDHGLESAEDRARCGKPAHGEIRLTARVSRSQVIITVQDDGRGIDPKKVLKKAMEKDIVAPNEVALLSDQDIVNFIFMPGFSTAEKVTAFSGRGVGMDAVKMMINDLGGKVALTSLVGQGSRVQLMFPADLSVEDIVLVESAGQTYAFLLSTVEAIIGLTDEDRKSLEAYPYYETDSILIPVAAMDKLLMSNRSSSPQALLLVEDEGNRVAIVVEKILRKEQVIVSPPPPAYVDARHITGIFAMDDGSLCAIINPIDLYNQHQKHHEGLIHAA